MNDATRHAPVHRCAGWLAAAAGIFAAASALAAPPLKTIEECLESGTRLVNLPGVAGGSLVASECRGCPSVRLRFDAGTRYFIGKELVPYARLREAAAKGDIRLYVFYRPGDRTLTRLRLAAAPAK
ncbi:MAG: hypothetical protein ACT4UP_10205 [Gammaproteobacteria bacterium]